jgi:hypothetical protein
MLQKTRRWKIRFPFCLAGVEAGVGQWSVVSGQWSVVSGQWSVVSGQWSVVSGQWAFLLQDPRSKIQDPRSKIQDPGRSAEKLTLLTGIPDPIGSMT